MISPLAGKPAPRRLLINARKLEDDYYERRPDMGDERQRVSFGTSGHRGTPLDGSFTEAHILAITQAICEYRKAKNITGPLFMGKDTHAASAAAQRTALEVLARNKVEVRIQCEDGFTPTPVISHAILAWNQPGQSALADGIVITPSHNPPADGGFKYNPPSGGPADTDVTGWIQKRANELLPKAHKLVKRMLFEKALKARATRQIDYAPAYIQDLASVINMEAIRAAKVRIGVDPLGGASVHYWDQIREHYKLNLTVVNPRVDPTFRFMTVDHDGVIRMDCSSRYAMQGLVKIQKKFDIAFGNDPDADRHGIVTPSHGLMNPNFYLATAIHFLHSHRLGWPLRAAVGKTIVSSSVIDRVVQSIGRRLAEVPVGFKWFAEGLLLGKYCFGGEESAGASFLRRDGKVWTTDKDGLILGLLAAEITAITGLDPAQYFHHLSALVGRSDYRRIDSPTTPEQKTALKNAKLGSFHEATLAGEAISSRLVKDPVNKTPIGGIKMITGGGWFAARPSGTENIIKIYAESFEGERHLDRIITNAKTIVDKLGGNPPAPAAHPARKP